MVTKWSLYWADLNPIRGSEQAGVRPVLVISNDIVNEVLPVITVIPVSSIKPETRIYVTEVLLTQAVSSLPRDSVAMIHQVRTISKDRLGQQCGRIEQDIVREQIKEAICNYLEL
jgi:mRNA interferase MazF